VFRGTVVGDRRVVVGVGTVERVRTCGQKKIIRSYSSRVMGKVLERAQGGGGGEGGSKNSCVFLGFGFVCFVL
jgi:hypothetical protein